jgi:ABC-type transport system substrate-binding protein
MPMPNCRARLRPTIEWSGRYVSIEADAAIETVAKIDTSLIQPASRARQNFDQAERKKLSEAQTIIAANIPMLPLFFSAEYAALRSSVQGFEWIPDQIPRFRDLRKKK